MFWYIALFVVSLVAVASAQKTPEAQPPPGLGDFDFPTAEEGREIPILFGTRDLKGPNVIWYGDLKTVAVKKKGGKK